ncbi:MAG: nucleotide exchange factor GrpE [Anaerolineae bacterium]
MNVSKKTQQIPVRRSGEADRADTDDRANAGPVLGEAVPLEAPVEAPPLPESNVATSAEVDWRDMALRLRAEMDNYRKRQQRLAEEQIAAERKRLLTAFLTVPDNLEKIIAHLRPDDPHHQSIKVAYDEFMKVLRLEGVEPLVTVGMPFDPLLHDAVAMVAATPGQREDMLVIGEEKKGYRLGEQVLRPARVIVAKR